MGFPRRQAQDVFTHKTNLHTSVSLGQCLCRAKICTSSVSSFERASRSRLFHIISSSVYSVYKDCLTSYRTARFASETYSTSVSDTTQPSIIKSVSRRRSRVSYLAQSMPCYRLVYFTATAGRCCTRGRQQQTSIV